MKMKAILRLLLVALFAASMLLVVSCSTSTYYVNFDADGGSAVDSVEVKHGETVGSAPITEKEGYTFNGWYLDNDKWDFEHYAVTRNITLKAKWIENFTVKFNSNGGTSVDSETVVSGSKVSAPVDPIKDDAEFIGWYKGDVKWNFAENTITEDITLTAKWLNIYTVKFNPDGSNYIAHQKIKDGGLVTKPSAPVRYGYEFAGWFAFDEASHEFLSDTAWDFEKSTVSENLTLKAKWIPIYTVSFDTAGAGKIDSIKLTAGSLVPAPAEISKDGYTFDGWFFGDVKWDFETAALASDVKLVAKWTAITYDVTFDANTGADDEVPTVLEVLQGGKLTAPAAPTLEGYAFLGWFVFNAEDESFSETPWNFETNTVTEDITLKAKWIKTYTVSFTVDGNVTESFTVYEGSLITAPEANPEKDGCAFMGWYNGNAAWSFETPVTSDVTLTAKFLTKHTVKFDLDGASSDAIDDVKLLFGEKVTKPADPVKPGYVFDGWYNGDVLWNFENPVTDNVTLKAKWSEMFTVEFFVDGNFYHSVKVADGHKLTAPTVPTKYLYLFAGWITQDKTEWNFDTDVVTGSISLNAKWVDNYYVITFDTDGAGTIDPVLIERGALLEEPVRPEKEGVGFEGWVYKSTGAPFDFTVAPTSDTILKAKWTPEFFEVKFYSNGTLVKTQTVAYNTLAQDPEINPDFILEKPGENFEFFGWTSIVKDGAWDFATDIVTSSIDLHADWREVFNVTLMTDGVVYDVLEAFEGKPAGSALTPVKRNYAFIGWYDADGNLWNLETKLVTANVTLEARWEPTATVRFDLLGGYWSGDDHIGYQTVKVGEKFTKPQDPVKSKYVFKGWYADGAAEPWNFDTPAEHGETILHAKWAPIYYVSFDLNGGEGSFAVQEIVSGGVAILPTEAPTKAYMTFDGWYLNGELYDFSKPVASDITLTAKWSRIKYTVTFDANGGEGGFTQKFEAGQTLTAPAVTREGYTVKEWQLKDGTVWNFATDVLEGDITLKVIWTNADITINFDINGGTSANGNAFIDSQTVPYGSLLTKFENPYMGEPNSEYVFKGWYRPDGTKWDFDKDVATANITLTAKWETKYDVKFETDEGVYEETTANGGELVLPPLVAPTKLGYKFLGWFDGETKWDFTTMTVSEDLVLVAKWEREVYTVTFVTRIPGQEELEVLNTITVYYGDFLTCPEENPFIGENYIFDSWRDTNGKVWNFTNDFVTSDLTIQAYWITPGTGTGGGVNGPWDEGSGTTQGPMHNFS